MRTFLAFLFLVVFNFGFGQEKFDFAAVEKFQNGLNSVCLNPEISPLSKKQRTTFKTLDFFPINEKFFVIAKFVRTDAGKPIRIDDNVFIKPKFIKYGEATFSIDGKTFKLDVYCQLGDLKSIEYKDKLFLPFTDFTTGRESYIGGRFVDLIMPTGDTIIIDFNRSYNPCSAFRNIYPKSKVPLENDLKIEIEAGVKKFRD